MIPILINMQINEPKIDNFGSIFPRNKNEARRDSGIELQITRFVVCIEKYDNNNKQMLLPRDFDIM